MIDDLSTMDWIVTGVTISLLVFSLGMLVVSRVWFSPGEPGLSPMSARRRNTFGKATVVLLKVSLFLGVVAILWLLATDPGRGRGSVNDVRPVEAHHFTVDSPTEEEKS